MIEIDASLSIPEDELAFTTSRSGGPGGQHVNTTSTRVTLLFDLAGSPSLSPEQKAILAGRLGSRLSAEGVLRVVCQQTRSQAMNKAICLERFAMLLREALRPRAKRRPTRLPKAEKVRRLESKRRRSEVKRERGRISDREA